MKIKNKNKNNHSNNLESQPNEESNMIPFLIVEIIKDCSFLEYELNQIFIAKYVSIKQIINKKPGETKITKFKFKDDEDCVDTFKIKSGLIPKMFFFGSVFSSISNSSSKNDKKKKKKNK